MITDIKIVSSTEIKKFETELMGLVRGFEQYGKSVQIQYQPVNHGGSITHSALLIVNE
jgi:hypothetical protein